jgi:phage FluMu protein Com
MIITEIFYGIRCNRCGELLEDGECSFWSDEGSAIENATESSWVEIKGKHYCPDCHIMNEETDEIIVFEEYPQPLKKLNRFIDKILTGVRRSIFENTDIFLIKCTFYSKPRLEIYEVDYIKSLMGEKFISLEYEDGKYGSTTCNIKIKKP